MQAELLQQRLGVAHQRFELVVALLGPRELEHFDLLKLVLPQDAARVFPAAPASERKHAVQAHTLIGKALGVERFVAVEAGELDFGRGREP